METEKFSAFKSHVSLLLSAREFSEDNGEPPGRFPLSLYGRMTPSSAEKMASITLPFTSSPQEIVSSWAENDSREVFLHVAGSHLL